MGLLVLVLLDGEWRNAHHTQKQLIGHDVVVFGCEIGVPPVKIVVVEVGEGMVIPIAGLPEQPRKVQIVTRQGWFLYNAFPCPHQQVNVFQNLEGFLPESQIGCHFELLEPHTNAPLIHFSVLDINEDSPLRISLVLLGFDDILESSPERVTESLKLVLPVVLMGELKEFLECFNVEIL